MEALIYISSITASLSYCYFISSKIPKGIYRFISVIPILYIFTILPLRFSFILPTAITFSFTTWLTNFKLIRFAFDLDQSPFRPSDSLVQFITIASLPIKKIPTNPTSIKSRSHYKLGFQVFIFFVLVKIVYDYYHQLHSKIISFIYGWQLFLLIDIVASVSNTILFLTTGLELEPSSDHPYLATSIQNFWGRWNLLVTNTLRYTVYKPVVEALRNHAWAPLAGIITSFLVSGLMHELFVYQFSRAAPTWEMTSFFMLHGFSVVVEMIIKRAIGGRWRLPVVIGWLLTMVYVMGTGVLMFIPPIVRARVDIKMLEEFSYFVNYIKGSHYIKSKY